MRCQRAPLGAGGFRCVDVNVEVGQVARDDVQEGMRAILSSLATSAELLGDDYLEATVERGVEQTLGYMKKCGAEEGHLVVFDRREEPAAPRLGGARERGVAVWTL